MIGYYVHHQGSGHLTRARTIAAACVDDVVGLSSLPAPTDGFADWVQLPRDDLDREPVEPTAHSLLHWAPIGSASVSARVSTLTTWVARARPRAVVIDVSVEAALAVRLAGARTIVVAQPGERDDAAHHLGYGLADLIVAPWPAAVYEPGWLRSHRHKVAYVGSISRFDGRRSCPAPPSGEPLVLRGTGGDVRSRDALGFESPRAGSPRAGSPRLDSADAVWQALQQASVVIAHAGQNVVAEVAAARRPAVVIADDRPFAEQRTTADVLARAGLAISLPLDHTTEELDGALKLAADLDPAGWSRWSFGDGAARAVRALERVALPAGTW